MPLSKVRGRADRSNDWSGLLLEPRALPSCQRGRICFASIPAALLSALVREAGRAGGAHETHDLAGADRKAVSALVAHRLAAEGFGAERREMANA